MNLKFVSYICLLAAVSACEIASPILSSNCSSLELGQSNFPTHTGGPELTLQNCDGKFSFEEQGPAISEWFAMDKQRILIFDFDDIRYVAIFDVETDGTMVGNRYGKRGTI